ncbi:MAG: hypothetical protein ACI80I_001802, partial [Akkermansiaceae bacterium]
MRTGRFLNKACGCHFAGSTDFGQHQDTVWSGKVRWLREPQNARFCRRGVFGVIVEKAGVLPS